MKKILLFIVVCTMMTSCVVTTKPRPNIRPTYKRYWYKPWYGPRHYQYYPPRHRHH